ncbi:MAG: GTPase ObgE, partial [Actinobacteria bacterium]|nr:GTPase ObgE [Actinomycetota bacterium]
MFLDEAKINIKAGDGGNGLVSFFFLKGRHKKVASGGDGGRGGNIVLEASASVSTLLGFKKKVHFKAENGQGGMPNNRSGRNGNDCIIFVPVGTIIKDKEKIAADLDIEGSRFIAAIGGIGGKGNAGFVSQERRFPGFAEKGEKVEDRWIELELRLLADAALMGFPNAGKSTIISRISAARPKIADYPFTTLVPNLGVVQADSDSFVVADIPGIIEGAHKGTGLGDKFLRHVLRSKVLVMVLDLSVFISEGYEKFVGTYDILRKELKLYDASLLKMDFFTVINKSDLVNRVKDVEFLKKQLEKQSGKPVILISAVSGAGLQDFVTLLSKKIDAARKEEPLVGRSPKKQKEDFRTYTLPDRERVPDKIEIIRDGSEYIIKNKKLERMVLMTDLENEEALNYLKY